MDELLKALAHWIAEDPDARAGAQLIIAADGSGYCEIRDPARDQYRTFFRWDRDERPIDIIRAHTIGTRYEQAIADRDSVIEALKAQLGTLSKDSAHLTDKYSPIDIRLTVLHS